jgi:hypothetical protein
MADGQQQAAYTPRLKRDYDERIVAAMTEKFGYKNRLEVPKLDKIVINMGVGEATQDKKKVETAAQEMELIAGQKPVITKAKKSIAQFKLREGMPIGVCTSSWTAWSRSRCRASATFVASIRARSTAAATTQWASRNRSFSLRSTMTASRRCAAWTSS